MSRLLESSAEYRESLETRNLYTPFKPYNLFEYNDEGDPLNPYLDNRKLANSINGLASIIKPFSSFDVTNTVLFRLVGETTPIAQTGLVLLARQMSFNVASNLAQQYLPAVTFSNIFDGDPNSNFIQPKIDFQITRSKPRGSINEIMNDIIGRTPPKSPLAGLNVGNYRFNGIENMPQTGRGQLTQLAAQINYNLYKSADPIFNSALEAKKLELRSGTETLSRQLLLAQGYNYPFSQYKTPLIDVANTDLQNSLTEYYSQSNLNGNALHEYGRTQTFVDDLGKTQIRNNNASGSYDFNSQDFGNKTDFNSQLVWGRDGASQAYADENYEYYERSSELNERGRNVDSSITNSRFSDRNIWDNESSASLGIKNGILEYTRELLNSKGKYSSFDMTKKKFLDTNEQLHFNGSPLDRRVDGQPDYRRRHSAADPYDRFAKAIRFNGNQLYGGNPNSVVYESVLPRIHPLFDGDKVDVKNLMFSIENLAIQATADDENNIGLINDPMGTNIPLCEVGPAGGRIMWFPPYDIRLSEQAVAKWENTSFIGRGEPIYTYSNSERLANLSFKLLIDYPPQVRDYRGQEDYQKVISEFFAFGGEGVRTNVEDVSKLVKRREELTDELVNIKPAKKLVDPQLPFGTSLSFYFPNDIPKEANATGTGVEYVLDLGYEDGFTDFPEECGKDFGLNEDFITLIDSQIEQFLNPEPTLFLENGTSYSNIDFVNIEFIGSATKLFNGKDEATYNQQLSERRIIAVQNYIDSRFKELFGTNKTPKDFGVKYIRTALGSTQSSDDFSTSDTICSLGAKEERTVQMTFVHNGNKQEKKGTLTPNQINNQSKIIEDITATEESINNTKRKAAAFSQCIFSKKDIQDGMNKGFYNMLTDKFNPVFHSQTPEDFHKRLTFLQQCTRQGPAIRSDAEDANSAKNSVFGRQPFCILRIGDFFHTKIVIDNISFSYEETTWDTNPEGMGMQPMIADISMSLRIVGGQSLKTPIEAIQNAASFNYYANSTFYTDGQYYETAADVESLQVSRNDGDKETTKTQKAGVESRGTAINTKELKAIEPKFMFNGGDIESGI